MNKAIFAAGCFWGVQYYFDQQDGVLATRVGYTGGNLDHPNYEAVCTDLTGHVEALEVTFDPNIVSYEELCKLFFEIHDSTQVDRQGPDIGKHYRSVIFYLDETQKQTAEKVIDLVKTKGITPATTLEPAHTFWEAEYYHQDFYGKNGGKPHCHFRRPIFD